MKILEIDYIFGTPEQAYLEELFVNFNWNPSEALALAKEGCTQCRGFGLRKSSRTGLEAAHARDI